jgi:hypothetical protein
MKRGVLVATIVAGALLAATPGFAQFQRYDSMWARSTGGAPLTLDGQMTEPQWALAESVLVRYPLDNGIPGSGWKDEGGFPATDRTYAVFRFLTVGDQLWMCATVRDSSIGGSKDFNRFDGLLMSIKNHGNGSRPASPGEHFISWWIPTETNDPNPLAVDHAPTMMGEWRDYPPGSPVTPTQLQAWDARVTWLGKVNSDTTADVGYTVEMRCDMPLNGYDITRPAGDIIEWNCSVYDIDWYWPLANFFHFSVNRSWIQGPWGNDLWYSDLKIHARPDVTVSSGPAPANTPDLVVRNLGPLPAPVIDGNPNEAVWGNAPSFDIRWDDATLRDSYPATGPWRSGQYQAPVNGNGGTAYVADPGDATVKYFFKGTKLYMAVDVRDQVVQNMAGEDRWDGVMVSINDRVQRYADNNLKSWRLGMLVGPGGAFRGEGDMTKLRDTLGVVQAQLVLKPGTTVDTLGVDVDAGYTLELSVDLAALGYPSDLGDRTLYFGVTLYDGDSYSPITDSYGTRTWFFREREYRDGPCVAFLDPNSYVTLGVDDPAPARLALAGNFPNPFKRGTTIRYSLPGTSRVDLEVYDLQGRTVVSQSLGMQSAGAREARVPQFASRSGVYLYRLHVTDGVTGADRGTLTGKMMVLQ